MTLPSRRACLKSAFTIIPALSARTYAANEKLNVAVVGCGSMGMGDIGRMVKLPINIVALCDVDSRDPVKRNPSKGSYDLSAARTWVDFREMLDKQKDIEAVFVATPDHTHAVISMRAMEMGKHVACEKPQARTISEMRAMGAAARKYKVATQCDMEGHAFDELRSMVEWVKAGVIGEVREVHIWEGGSDRPRGYPGTLKNPLPVPDYLNWDLWLGPASSREYHAGLHPGSWRGCGISARALWGTGAGTCSILRSGAWIWARLRPSSHSGTAATSRKSRGSRLLSNSSFLHGGRVFRP